MLCIPWLFLTWAPFAMWVNSDICTARQMLPSSVFWWWNWREERGESPICSLLWKLWSWVSAVEIWPPLINLFFFCGKNQFCRRSVWLMMCSHIAQCSATVERGDSSPFSFWNLHWSQKGWVHIEWVKCASLVYSEWCHSYPKFE